MWRAFVLVVLLLGIVSSGACEGPSRPEAPQVENGDGSDAPSPTEWAVRAHYAPVLDLAWRQDSDAVAVFAMGDRLTLLDADAGTSIEWPETADRSIVYGSPLVGAIAWSRDGRRVALPGRVFDASTWQRVTSLALEERHTSDALAFSPDGTMLAGGTRPGAGGQVGCICLVVWDVATGSVLHSIDTPRNAWESRGYVSSVDWSPDGTQVVVASTYGSFVYDLPTAEVAIDLPAAQAVAWSHDGTAIALSERRAYGARAEAGIVWIMNAVTGRRILERRLHDGVAYSLAWLPGSSRLVTAGLDGTVAVVAADSLAELERFRVGGAVRVVRVSSDGRHLAIGTVTGLVYLMPVSLDGGGVRGPIGGGRIHAVTLSPGDRFAASAGSDETVRIWSTASGALITELQPGGRVSDVRWSPDERWLALAADTISLFRWPAMEPYGSMATGIDSSFDEVLAFNADGSILAVGTMNEVVFFDPERLTMVRRYQPPEEPFLVTSVAWSPSDDVLAMSSEWGVVWLIDMDGTTETRIEPIVDHVGALAWSSDGTMITITGWDSGFVKRRTVIVDVQTLDVIHAQPYASQGPNYAVGFTADDAWFWAAGAPDDGSYGGSAGDMNALKVWNMADGALVYGIDGTGLIGGAAFADDGSYVLTGSWSGELSKWVVP